MGELAEFPKLPRVWLFIMHVPVWRQGRHIRPRWFVDFLPKKRRDDDFSDRKSMETLAGNFVYLLIYIFRWSRS